MARQIKLFFSLLSVFSIEINHFSLSRSRGLLHMKCSSPQGCSAVMEIRGRGGSVTTPAVGKWMWKYILMHQFICWTRAKLIPMESEVIYAILLHFHKGTELFNFITFKPLKLNWAMWNVRRNSNRLRERERMWNLKEQSGLICCVSSSARCIYDCRK